MVHSCGDCEVNVPMGSRTFDFVLVTDFFIEHSPILSLTLQASCVLEVDHGDGGESVPLEQSEHT